ncbi:MAG: YkgJ family cysteine cluster protein [Nitrospirales bacterium]
MPAPKERFNLSVTTTSGDIHAQLDIPTGFISITDIVPVVRALGEQAQDLEVARTLQAGKSISCQKGCAACCRIMIPVSPPEAFALVDVVKTLPEAHQTRIRQNLQDTQRRLEEAGLLSTLEELAQSPRQQSDKDFELINRAYYALRLPCIFLEDEICSIYEHRPAGCRGHLVSSPPELCQDSEKNPVEGLHIPIRSGTVLSILWAELIGGPLRLLPLPMAFGWAKAHQDLKQKTWKGMDLLNKTLDGLEKFLRQTLTSLPQKTTMPAPGALISEEPEASPEQPTERLS